MVPLEVNWAFNLRHFDNFRNSMRLGAGPWKHNCYHINSDEIYATAQHYTAHRNASPCWDVIGRCWVFPANSTLRWWPWVDSSVEVCRSLTVEMSQDPWRCSEHQPQHFSLVSVLSNSFIHFRFSFIYSFGVLASESWWEAWQPSPKATRNL